MSAPPAEWRAWRDERRAALIAARGALGAEERAALDGRLLEALGRALPPLAGPCLGLYWPVRGEPDLLALAEAPAVRVALPVGLRRDAPVEFHAWAPGEPLRRAGFGVPVPERPAPVRAEMVLVPLLGFDDRGYRLGYGSGCYDRTLAAARPAPLAVGVGYELGRLTTIHPRWHDVPMDLPVTERGVHRPARGPVPVSEEEQA